jgi:hypothetical protein
MMSINIYNPERYFDPTPFEALTQIEAEAKKKVFRPLVFICSPYAGDTERNIENARRYCRFAVSKNAIPFAPHLLFPQFMEDDDKEQRNLGLFFGMVFMSKCLEMWVFGKNITKGMSVEIEKAQQRGMKIRYFTDRCEEVPENERA